MTQLFKGMYGSGTNRLSHLFGLRAAQARAYGLVPNAGWFNKAGQRLGHGDLSRDDFRFIAGDIEEGELFIVLPEGASTWNLIRHIGRHIDEAEAQAEFVEPGIDYVAESAKYVIARGEFMYVDRLGDYPEGAMRNDVALGEIPCIRPEGLKKLMGSPVAA